jgi:hypothetical protein
MTTTWKARFNRPMVLLITFSQLDSEKEKIELNKITKAFIKKIRQNESQLSRRLQQERWRTATIRKSGANTNKSSNGDAQVNEHEPTRCRCCSDGGKQRSGRAEPIPTRAATETPKSTSTSQRIAAAALVGIGSACLPGGCFPSSLLMKSARKLTLFLSDSLM